MLAALALIGTTAIIGQIVLMRELIVVFNGNEISLGILLATWLFWTAAGSGVMGRLALGGNLPRRAVVVLESLQGLSLPPTIWALRASRALFQTVPGELVGPVPMLLTSLVCLSVFCTLSGTLFVAAARMYAQECGVSGRDAVSSAYLLEAAGSGVGGVLASVLLLCSCNAFQIAAVVLLLDLGMAAVLSFRMGRRQMVLLALGMVLLAVLPLRYIAPRLEVSSQGRLWQGFQLLGTRDSLYGNLAVIGTGEVRSIYDNGMILASTPDANAAEEAVHYALLEHPAPRRVLLIGGGINGSIAEALKHPTLERLDYVELDPVLLQMARQFFPAQHAAFLMDPRVHIHAEDGRHYLLTTHDRFDVIILDLPDPQTAQLDRFYTVEFFRLASQHLAAGGVLALQLRSSEDYISPDRAEFLRCILHTLRQVFPYSVILPGETIHFFAAMRPNVLTDSPQVLLARLRERKLQTRYVREYFLPFRMMPDRMAQVREQLRPLASTPVNRDFVPIAYYFDMVLWGSEFHAGPARWFRDAARLGFSRILDWSLIVLLFLAALLVLAPSRERRARAAAAYCVAATGATLMTLQIFLLLTFQSIYGYVYQQLAVLIAMFMSGIAFGSWLALRCLRSRDGQSWMGILAMTQALLAISGPALIFLAALLSRTSNTTAMWLVAQFVFPILAALCGMLGGLQFPIATETYLRNKTSQAGLGTLYAIDLLGGCAGALLLSTYLIPVFGCWRTAWLSAAVGLAPALLAARAGLEERASRA
jgi:spermidine synthase